MSKMVIFARSIKPDWLDKTVEIYLESENQGEIKQKVNAYLAGFISSKFNLRKTRAILMKIWVDVDDSIVKTRDKAIEVFKTCPASDRVAVHWAMMLLAFPIFKDLCAVIGKLADNQDEVKLAQIKQRIYELWGERTSLAHSIYKNIKTLKDCGAIEQTKPGYYIIKKRKIKNREVVCLLIHAVMKTNGKLYYNLTGITKFKELFPFEYDIGFDNLNEFGLFKMDRIGGEPVISI